MKRPIIILAASALLLAAGGATAQTTAWVHQFGVSIEEATSALAPDGSGGVLATGYSYGALYGPQAGKADVWLARYDSAGGPAWAIQFGTPAAEVPFGIARDASGSVFLAGSTHGELGGAGMGEGDAWLARYSDSGTRDWIVQFGSSANEWAQAVASDESGGVYVAGWTLGDLGGPSAGDKDAWLARYDSSGVKQWVTQFGTPEEDWAVDIAPDGAGGVYVTGYTFGDLGGASAGGQDVWLARYDASGARRWIIQFGTDADDIGVALAPDGAGGVFMAGSTFGALGGPNAGDSDVWLARYDSTGARVWITQFGTAMEDRLATVAPAGQGAMYLAGITQGELGGPWAGRRDVWIARHGADGRRTWVHQFGSDASDIVYSLAPATRSLFAGGFTTGELASSLTGYLDAWLARFDDSTACYADCDGSGSLDFFDFLCFQNLFAAGDPGADCDQSGSHDFFDFLCFQNAFVAGCP